MMPSISGCCGGLSHSHFFFIFVKWCIFVGQMGIRLRHKTIKGYAILLLTIFITYLCSNTLFIHNHSFEGRVVVHSHIYNGTPDKPEHDHTKSQFDLIATLSEFLALKASLSSQDFTPIYLLCCIIAVAAECVHSFSVVNIQLRAPPVMM